MPSGFVTERRLPISWSFSAQRRSKRSKRVFSLLPLEAGFNTLRKLPSRMTNGREPKLHIRSTQNSMKHVVERFRKVIHATPKNLPDREYGPKLICEKCDGNGFYLTEKRQIKKPCTTCSETGKILEPRLGFPCTTCRFKKHCWPQAKLQFDGRKPVWVVSREVAEETLVIHPDQNTNRLELGLSLPKCVANQQSDRRCRTLLILISFAEPTKDQP